MAQPTNAITAEYLRQLHARRASAGSPGSWRRRSELERLIDRTVLELHPTLGSCWIWTGPASPYGRIEKGPERTERSTHRLGWMILRGSDSGGPWSCTTAVSGTPAGTPTTWSWSPTRRTSPTRARRTASTATH